MSFADPRGPRAPQQRGEAPPSIGSGRAPRDFEQARGRSGARAESDASPIDRPRGSSYRRSVDWEHVGLVGAGLLVGALLGAGTALLLAPQSGRDARVEIGRRARSARYRARDAWDELADELTAATRRGRRRARRALTRARWRASDAMA